MTTTYEPESRPAHLQPAERAAIGVAARKQAPLDSHADLVLGPDRPDPVGILLAQDETRLPELVPIRHGRMLVSPFTFYRGAAAVMAADLARTPRSGLVTQVCGDAHLSNFGVFGSPERRLVFDINDFDETIPGPWEWDVKRLAASFAVAARERGFGRKQRAAVVLDAVGGYRQAMAGFAEMSELRVWYAHADFDQLAGELASELSKSRRKKMDKAQAKARTRDSLEARNKLTAVVDGRRRIIADPPLVVPIGDLLPDRDRAEFETQIRDLLSDYRDSLPDDRRVLIDRFRYIDLARKVVGVGSVGTRCWVVLLQGRDDDDPLLLQLKEAPPSVLADHVGDTAPRPPDNQGLRVVSGQRLMQAVSDIFLGWQRAHGIDGRQRDFYVRQLRDWKGSAVVEQMDVSTMRAYGRLCGLTLARAHARSGDRVAIAAYLGDDATFDRALVEFAEGYADQTERDHEAMAAAAKSGRIEATSGL
jgi:uncharacterized protein (DUF2252 family)